MLQAKGGAWAIPNEASWRGWQASGLDCHKKGLRRLWAHCSVWSSVISAMLVVSHARVWPPPGCSLGPKELADRHFPALQAFGMLQKPSTILKRACGKGHGCRMEGTDYWFRWKELQAGLI